MQLRLIQRETEVAGVPSNKRVRRLCGAKSDTGTRPHPHAASPCSAWHSDRASIATMKAILQATLAAILSGILVGVLLKQKIAGPGQTSG